MGETKALEVSRLPWEGKKSCLNKGRSSQGRNLVSIFMDTEDRPF